MLRVVTLLLRALPLPLLLLLFALAECQLVSECADVLPSTDYHRQLCAASDDEATATVRSSLAGFDSGAIRRRVEGTLHCKQHLCGTAVTAPRVQSGVPDYVLALAPKCGSSSFRARSPKDPLSPDAADSMVPARDRAWLWQRRCSGQASTKHTAEQNVSVSGARCSLRQIAHWSATPRRFRFTGS